jgi:acetyltransferase-like isoleucine patch superfamily enzyme
LAFNIIDQGQGNVVEVAPDTAERGSGTVILRGNGNTVRIGPGGAIQELYVELGSGCTLDIGEAGSSLGLFVFGVQDALFDVAEYVNFNARDRLLAHEPGSITIGPRCLFASNIDVTVSDMHSVFDAATGERLNPARDVLIGEHVWVADRCTVMKGARIGANAVIGAASVVTGTIPPGALAAGAPARVIREGITWHHELLPSMPGM